VRSGLLGNPVGRRKVRDRLSANAQRALRALSSRKVHIECDRLPHEFERVPFKKILNWIMVEASIHLGAGGAWGWPTHLQIEPSSRCNLRCTLCPVTEGLSRPTGNMSLDVFRRLIDEVGPYVFLIILWDWGEPFLNPLIYDMISYAKRWDIKLVTSTNGHVFAHGDHAERLVLSGLDSIIFSVDGLHQTTYEKYRQGGDLATVLEGIQRVLEARRALKSTTPLVDLRFIVMRHNEHEIPQLPGLARSLGVDALTLRTLNTYDDGECCSTQADGGALLPTTVDYQPFRLDPRDGSRIRRAANPCKALWNNPAIHADGRVCPCTFDARGRYVLGDLNKESFRDIWWGAPYRRLRRRFRRDYRGLVLCSECQWAFEGGSMGEERDVEVHFFDGGN
jgi:radical SAM protein with 4Fe4S-binding SPASM domain